MESLLIEASRSGRSRSFEAVIRLKDHLHRYPKFNRAGNIYGKSLVKYLTMRLDDETNQLLIAAKIVVDGVKQMRLQTELLII
ncbi:TraY domain-containing protein [Escherichia coli]|nr:TraY domain-containing protein [Escherichia coli]